MSQWSDNSIDSTQSASAAKSVAVAEVHHHPNGLSPRSVQNIPITDTDNCICTCVNTDTTTYPYKSSSSNSISCKSTYQFQPNKVYIDRKYSSESDDDNVQEHNNLLFPFSTTSSSPSSSGQLYDDAVAAFHLLSVSTSTKQIDQPTCTGTNTGKSIGTTNQNDVHNKFTTRTSTSTTKYTIANTENNIFNIQNTIHDSLASNSNHQSLVGEDSMLPFAFPSNDAISHNHIVTNNFDTCMMMNVNSAMDGDHAAFTCAQNQPSHPYVIDIDTAGIATDTGIDHVTSSNHYHPSTPPSSVHYDQVVRIKATSSNNHESMNFSKLMRQADNSTPIMMQPAAVASSTSACIVNTSGAAAGNPTLNASRINNDNAQDRAKKSVSFSLVRGDDDADNVYNNNELNSLSPSIHATSSTYHTRRNIGISSNNRRPSHGRSRGEVIKLTNLTNDSFQLCVQLSPSVSVRDVVDIIANPDMLRFWCEPITALVVTDHRGGSSACGTGTGVSGSGSHAIGIGRRRNLNDCEVGDKYHYPNVEDCDDDVIVPPAEDIIMNNMVRRKGTCKEVENTREEYADGEWIKASTPEIILPHAHNTLIDNCYKKVSNLLGFPSYGNVTMFVERSRAQVGFSVGPFKGGTMLSHKIVVVERGQGGGEGVGGGERGQDVGDVGVILMDEVTVVASDEEEVDGWVLCSCFESVLDITRSWYKASLDGYIDQTKASLMNLVDLVEGGGETFANQSNRRKYNMYGNRPSSSSSSAMSNGNFINDNSVNDPTEPLLT